MDNSTMNYHPLLQGEGRGEVMIRDIMVANPQSAKRDSLMQKLDERIVPMPDDMKEEIAQGIYTQSLKEELESESGYYRNRERKVFYDLIRCFHQDSLLVSSRDSIKQLRLNDESLESKYSLAFIYLAEDSTSRVNEVLSDIPGSFTLSQTEFMTHQDYLSYFSILTQMTSGGIGSCSVYSLYIPVLQLLATGDYSLPCAYARNALIGAGLLDYMEPIVLDDTNGINPSGSIRLGNDTTQSRNSNESYIRIFPNPAVNYFIIEFEDRSDNVNKTIRIKLIDNYGRTIRELWSNKSYAQILVRTETMTSGSYLCELWERGKRKASTKFILSK